MDIRIQNSLGVSVIAVLLASIFGGFWYTKSFLDTKAIQRTFQVQGEGKVVAVPDIAEISFIILTEGGKNISDLQKENTKKANAAIAFLKDSGIDEKDIKTQSYSVSPRYQYYSCPPVIYGTGEKGISPESCPPSEIVGYSIQQTILVKVRDLNKTGDILSGIVASGSNNVYGPNFTIDDPNELQNEAREKAIAEAKERAKSIARAGGFRVGRLVAVQEGFITPWPMSVVAFGAEKGGVGGGTPDIEPGSQEVSATVYLTYEIR